VKKSLRLHAIAKNPAGEGRCGKEGDNRTILIPGALPKFWNSAARFSTI